MGFMVPVAEFFAAYHVETNAGTEIVPEEVCGAIEIEDDLPTDDGLDAYLESTKIRSVERKEGWYARLSAPGYLDCSWWSGPFDSADDALANVKEFYDVDDNGDDAAESEARAALLCDECGLAARSDLTAQGCAPESPNDETSYESYDFPKGPYPDGGGEADSPQHCDHCGVFLENPLTIDGVEYVRETLAIERQRALIGRKKWHQSATALLQEWSEFYGIESL